MEILWTLLYSSAFTICALVLLFYVETRRQKRFIEPVRAWCDRHASRVVIAWHRLMLYIGGGSGKMGLHYLAHTLLQALRSLLRLFERLTERLQKRNHKMARTTHELRAESHLAAIKAHRKATELTDEEKTALKEKSLAG